MKTKQFHFVPLTLLLLVLSVCSPGACLGLFNEVTLTLEDENGAPVPGASVQVILERTGEMLEVEQKDALSAEGIYVVIDDSFKNKIRQGGDKLIVVFSRGEKEVQAEIEVKTDEGRCGVQKVSGPTVVTF